MDVRTLLAAVLGVGLGLLLLARPAVVVRAQTAGRLPDDRSGEYGTESSPPERWLLLTRLLGAGTLLAGLYFGATVVGVTGTV